MGEAGVPWHAALQTGRQQLAGSRKDSGADDHAQCKGWRVAT
jgi:hypothetical protein